MSTDRRRSSASSKSGKSVGFRITEDTKDDPQSTSYGLNFSRYCEDFKLELLKLASANNLFLIMIYVVLLSASFSMGLLYAMQPKISENVQCHIKELDKVKWSFDQKKNLSSPNKGSLQQGCSYYNINYSMLTGLSYEDAAEEANYMIIDNPHPKKCTKYLYKSNISKEFSVIREFNLICERKTFYSFNFFTQVGGAIGAFPLGIVSDIYGRKSVFIIGGLITVIGGCITPLAPNLPFFITGKIIMGGGSIALFLTVLVIFTELCRNKYRPSLMLLSFIAWHLGVFIHDAVLFTHIKVWRLLELANVCPFLIIIPSIIFVPESPRWLMNQKQLKKAWDVLHLMGSTEISEAPDYPFDVSTFSKQIRIFIKTYFQYRTYISIMLSGIAALTYYAILSLSERPINQIADIIIKTSMKIIFLLLISRAIYSCAKRCICCSLFLLLSTCFIASIITTSLILNDITLLLAEIFSVTVYMVIIIYVLEIFPTTHRATALGLNLSLSQFIKLIYFYYQYEMTYKVSFRVLKGFLCSFCVISALVTLLAPSTYQDIPDTKEDLIRDLSIAEQIAFSY